jgi:hypothetical protein
MFRQAQDTIRKAAARFSRAPESQARGVECGPQNIAALPTAAAYVIRGTLTDEEWTLVERMIPPAKRGG